MIFTGLTSTIASLGGGLVMYYQGLSVLTDTVEEVSQSDLQALGDSTKGALDQTLWTCRSYGDMLQQYQGLNNPADMSTWVKERVFTDLKRGQDGLEAGQFIGYNNATGEGFQDSVWYDPLKNGDREYVSCKHLPGVDDPATECAKPCIMCHALDPVTGLKTDNIYNYSSNRFAAHNAMEVWTEPSVWFSSDDNAYAFLDLAVVVNNIPNPLFAGYSVLIACDFLLSKWDEILTAYHTPDSHLMLASNAKGALSAVFAGNFPEARPDPNCKDATRGDDLMEFHPCLRYLWQMPKVAQDVVRRLNNTAPGSFVRASTADGDHWMSQALIHEQSSHPDDKLPSIYLVWYRDVSTIQGQMNSAVTVFIIFAVTVFVFDVVIGLLEIFLIASPLRKLALAVAPLQMMDLETSASMLKESPAFGCKEVCLVEDAIRFCIKSLAEYKAFLPTHLFVDERDTDSVPPSENEPTTISATGSRNGSSASRTHCSQVVTAAMGTHLVLSTSTPGSLMMYRIKDTIDVDGGSWYAKMVSALETSVTTGQGVLHQCSSMDPCTFLISFNIVKKCIDANTRACGVALMLKANGSSCGVVHRSFRHGNIGSQTFRNFAVVGDKSKTTLQHVFAVSTALSQAEGQTRVCCCDRIASGLFDRFLIRTVAFVEDESSMCVVSALLDTNVTEETEWYVHSLETFSTSPSFSAHISQKKYALCPSGCTKWKLKEAVTF